MHRIPGQKSRRNLTTVFPVLFGEEAEYLGLAQSRELWQGLPDPGLVDRVLQDSHSHCGASVKNGRFKISRDNMRIRGEC